jgi:hypothetical protein
MMGSKSQARGPVRTEPVLRLGIEDGIVPVTAAQFLCDVLARCFTARHRGAAVQEAPTSNSCNLLIIVNIIGAAGA